MESTVNAVSVQAAKNQLYNRDGADKDIQPATVFPHGFKSGMERVQLFNNGLVQLFRIFYDMNFVQPFQAGVQKPVDEASVYGNQNHCCNEDNICDKPENCKHCQMCYVFYEKRKLGRHQQQGKSQRRCLMCNRFRGDNSGAFTGLHSHFGHIVNLHGLSARGKWCDGGVKNARNANHEGAPISPAWIQMTAQKPVAQAFQYPCDDQCAESQQNPKWVQRTENMA